MQNPLKRKSLTPSPRPTWTPFQALAPDFLRPFDESWFAEANVPFPSIDIEERESDVHVTAEVPGMKAEDLDIQVMPSGDMLLMQGEKRSEKENEDRGYRNIERIYGSFRREIPLPTRVDGSKVAAKLDQGVLTIDLPKADGGDAPHRVQIG